MKYIRTKSGKIIKILKEEIDEFGKYGMVDEENCIRYRDDFKQADTIEELCDEFVGITEDGERFVFSNTKENELFVKEQNKYHTYTVIYGAIWTDKGLIYVAKMNEKGELELL